MKKLLTALVGICAIIFASNIVNAQDLNSAIQDAIISNQKLGSCSAGVVNDGLTIIGLTNNNECHYKYYYHMETYQPEKVVKKIPLKDCYVPMTVLKKYTDASIAELKQGNIGAMLPDSQYCKNVQNSN